MNWLLAVFFLIVGALTGDLLLAVEIIALITVGVLVLKRGEKQLAKETAERLAKAVATEKRMKADGINIIR